MSYSYISAALRQQVYNRANGCCEYCLIPEVAVLFTHQVDHIIAEKHGGLTEDFKKCVANYLKFIVRIY